HSGQVWAAGQLHACAEPRNVGAPVGVMATKPTSKSGEAPENAPPMVTVRKEPPPYGIGRAAPPLPDPVHRPSCRGEGPPGEPAPLLTLMRPLVSVPWPAPNWLHALPVGSSFVPYWQSGPGSLVSISRLGSLSPVCGFEVLITPKPQAVWFTLVQKLSTPGPI